MCALQEIHVLQTFWEMVLTYANTAILIYSGDRHKLYEKA
ncbi:hypothetical protein NOS3756_06070 [Nostoc sp. NIES-3756]|nr:hypothetical protein NOS3756_06070 [Nostoc sp. NIES-3756]